VNSKMLLCKSVRVTSLSEYTPGIKYTTAKYHFPCKSTSNQRMLSLTLLTFGRRGLSELFTKKPRPPPLLRFLSLPTHFHSVPYNSAFITVQLSRNHALNYSTHTQTQFLDFLDEHLTLCVVS